MFSKESLDVLQGRSIPSKVHWVQHYMVSRLGESIESLSCIGEVVRCYELIESGQEWIVEFLEV
jgi:hypothetical protein